MYNYCTLFDSNYLIRGLAMYNSLKENSDKFHLYVFSFDELSNKILKELNLENLTVISLKEFENEELLKVKSGRTPGEYCWTSTPLTILYCIEKYGLDFCTYVDADIYFFSNPEVLIKEMVENNNSILLTEHRYTKIYNQEITSGKYCVQFMTFKNDKRGLKALNWWKDQCLNWCYARVENGKFGDQKYLDDWKERFEGVHILGNLGGGVAPWNVQQYKIDKINNNKILLNEKANNNNFELIFYHFHNFKVYNNNFLDLGTYKYDKESKESFYNIYLLELERIKEVLSNKNFKHKFDYSKKLKMIEKIKRLIKSIKKCIINKTIKYYSYNIHKITVFAKKN